MSWLVRLLGIDRVRAAFARLARAADAFAEDFESAAAKVRGRQPAALEDKGKGRKAPQEA
jgi:hypothetical protein